MDSSQTLHKFCNLANRDYGCRDAFGCETTCNTCPLQDWIRVKEELDRNPNLELSRAYYKVTERPVSDGDRKEVFKERFLRAQRAYPVPLIVQYLEEYVTKNGLPGDCIIVWKDGQIREVKRVG